jgi:hypothetical protein
MGQTELRHDGVLRSSLLVSNAQVTAKIRRLGDVPDGAILVRFLPIRAVVG